MDNFGPIRAISRMLTLVDDDDFGTRICESCGMPAVLPVTLISGAVVEQCRNCGTFSI